MTEVYTPPQSELGFKRDDSMEVINELAHQGTLRLLILSFITLGVYTAFYINRQIEVINNYVDEPTKISDALINSIFTLAFTSIVFFISFFFVEGL